MSGLTSQPSMGAVCMALEQTSMGTGIRYEDIQSLNLYWSQVRMLYSCFEANVRASDSSVFDHEMPGGQYTNLMVRLLHLSLSSLSDCMFSSSKHPSLASEHSGQVMCFLLSPRIMSFPQQICDSHQAKIHRSQRTCRWSSYFSMGCEIYIVSCSVETSSR